jgi:SAM-dependent methyltransferase
MVELPAKLRRLHALGVKRGLEAGTSIIEDWLFDYRHQSETSSKLEIGDYEPSLKHLKHVVPYQPVPARSFRYLMRQLMLPPDSVFVDVGCGKGRALLLVADRGFKRLVGIDISPKLCAVAERNLSVLRERRAAPEVSVVAADILEYQFRHDENVFFLYNPFDEVVISQFLAKVEQSIKAVPRQIWLIYLKPRTAAREIIEGLGTYIHVQSFTYGNARFLVYISHRHAAAA